MTLYESIHVAHFLLRPVMFNNTRRASAILFCQELPRFLALGSIGSPATV